jgi:hypothetical protein
MAEVENIIAAVIVMFILLVSGLIYMTTFAADTVHNFGVKHDVFYDDARINDLNTVLRITEPESGRPMGVLLADAVYYRNETLEFSNKTINITQKVAEVLAMPFNTTGYYLEVRPRIIEVSLNFIIDGSNSLDEERKTLSSHLVEILDKIEKKINDTNAGYAKTGDTLVIANIYILHTKKEQCELFDNLSDSRIKCAILDQSQLYLKNNATNTSDYFINMSQYDLQAYLSHYNMTPPFGFGWNNTYSYTEEYFMSDWGYGMGYASNFDHKTTLSRLTILFPMGDELSTSSIADRCFNETKYDRWVTCSLCRDECPVNRSRRSIDRGLQVAMDNNHIINPIFSYSCDYDYKPFFTDIYNSVYKPSPNATHSCSRPNCLGCTLNGSSVCFHPSCSDEILVQMGDLANQTAGRMIDLQDIATMDVNISDTIRNNIDQYAITIGDRHPELERDVIETTQPLPNGQLVDVRLWVYKNQKVYKV